jgi:ABC-2 type transport system ATP-binding protein
MDAAFPARLTHVTRRFRTIVALDDVSFAVNPGEVVGLLGPNGAGKTTLVRVLLGLIRPTSGTVALWGLPPWDPAARRRVGVMLQVGRVPETLTVREHVRLFSSYYGTPQPVEHTLDAAGVTAIADRRFGELSGGQRQCALFAIAICGQPALLVLDEPTVGLDLEARRTFWQAVGRLIARGAAVLLTTHYLEEAERVSSRIAILRRGRMVADGTCDELKAQAGASTLYDAYFAITSHESSNHASSIHT